MVFGPRLFSRFISMAASESSVSPGTFSVAYVTTPNSTVAKELAKKLIERKLAACVNVVPQVTSVYTWEDKLMEDEESLMIIKTRSALVSELSKFVRENHPYDCAEVISMKIENGNPPYLSWLDKSTKLAPSE